MEVLIIDRPPSYFSERGVYQIRVKGFLDQTWASRFEGLTVKTESNDGSTTTLLAGRIADQAALHGILDHIRDLNLQLLMVQRLEPEDPPGKQTESPTQ